MPFTVTPPLAWFTPPFHVRAALLVSVPPLVKLVRVAAPVWARAALLYVVVPVNAAPASRACVPGPYRNPPVTAAPLYSTVPPADGASDPNPRV